MNFRASSSYLDGIIGFEHKVLDKGFVRVVDYMGDDTAIVNAARVSYGKGTKKSRDDSKLIEYLLKNKHMGPFEMCEIKFHIKLPLFVARQWVRHRTANVNEQSARYSILENEFYIPSEFMGQSTINLQSSGFPLDEDISSKCIEDFNNHCSSSFDLYDTLMEKGVSREISRMILPLNIYTQWYWKIDLRNLLNFISLRISKDAQYEIREYARVIFDIVKLWVPFTFDAFEKYSLNSKSLCSNDIDVIKLSIKNGKFPDIEETNLTKSDYEKMKEIFS